MSAGLRFSTVVARISWMLFAMVVIIFSSATAEAQSYTYPDSCYVCQSYSMVASECVNPPDGTNGDTKCTIARFFVAVVCVTGPPACMYSCFGSGCDTGGGSGGGGGTGSGGSTCNTNNGACPADCFSCGGAHY